MGLIFHKQDFSARNRRKTGKNLFITRSDTPFLTGDAARRVPNRDIQWCDIGADIRFTCGTFVQRLIYILKESLRQAQRPTGQWNIRHARLVYLPNHCDRHVNEPSGQRGDIPYIL